MSTLAQHLTFDVDGMTCAGCVKRVESTLARVEHVTSAAANLTTGRVEVAVSSTIDPAVIVAALDASGYDARLHSAA